MGRNQALFREANERIEAAADGVVDEPPFICECADPGCTALIRLTLDEYESVRAEARRFFNAPGHESASKPWSRVLERNDRYVVVEKTGDAGEAAERASNDQEGAR